MEKKKELKRNKAIQITAIIMLVIAAIAIVLILPLNTITANAAAENLLTENIELNMEGLGNGPTIELNRLIGLEEATYTINYSFNGEERSTTANARFITMDPDESIGINVYIEFYQMEITVDADTKTTVNIMEGIDQETLQKAEKTYISIDRSSSGQEDGITVIINSITKNKEPLKSTDIISNVTGGFTNFLTGTGEGIATFFEKIFTNAEGGISIMAIVFLSLMGLGLASGVIRILLNRF